MSALVSDAAFEELNQRGVALANAGALQEAADVFREAARARPSSHKPHANLALVWKKLSRFADAVASLEEAVRLSPENARLHARLAQAALELGTAERAIASATRAHQLDPRAEHAHLAARAHFAAEQFENALRFARLTPPPHGRHVEIASLLLLGRLEDARAAISVGDVSTDGLLQLTGVALDSAATDLAGELLACVESSPQNREQAALFSVLAAAHALREGDADQARETLASVDEAALSPGGVLELHRAWVELGDPTRATAVTDRALRGTADDREILNRDGESALSADRPDIARLRFEQSLRVAPANLPARIALARTRAALGETTAALAALDEIAADAPLEPQAPYHASFARLHSLPEAPLELLERLSRFSERFLVARSTTPQRPRDLGPDRRLRVGYVSADVRDHAVMRFASGLLREHDRAAFEVHCYSASAKRDAVTRAIAALSLSFHDILGKPADVVAAQIAADEIDLLVDLGGHTSELLPIFARRPAPVQLTWLGFPATTGLSAIDIRVGDWRSDPATCDAFCSERLERLPHSAWSFEEPLDVPITPRPSGGTIVFGSFNRAMKLSDDLLSAWGTILAALPGAQLSLKGRGLSSSGARARVLSALERAGADPSSVRFSGMLVDRKQHLAAWGDVDICLDTFPYAGTTTTCESLFMGVPVVTRTGESHVSRVGASLLEEVGLGDLVASDWQGYRDAAVSLARDDERRKALRLSLRGRLAASPLGSAAAFTRSFERMLRGAWRAYCESAAAGAEVTLRRVRRPFEKPDVYTSPDLAERRTFLEHEGRLAPDAAFAIAMTSPGDRVLLVDPASAAHALELANAVGDDGLVRLETASPAVATTLRAAGRGQVIDAAVAAPLEAHGLIEAPIDWLRAALDTKPAPQTASLLVRISDPDRVAPFQEQLARRGLTVLRLIPGLSALSASATRATAGFIAGPQRLDALARAGVLVGPGVGRPSEGAAERVRACLGACALEQAPSREAVSLYLRALDGSLDLAARAALLEAAFEASADVADDPVGGALTRARLALDLGLTEQVEAALSVITDDARAPERQFLAAHPRNESGPSPGQSVARWALLQALERRVLDGADSSFDQQQHHLQLIERFFQAAGQSRELNRRLGLLLALGSRRR